MFLTKKFIFIPIVISLLFACATKSDLKQTNSKLEDFLFKIKKMELERRDSSRRLAYLESQGIRSGKKYRILTNKLSQIKKEQNAFVVELKEYNRKGTVDSSLLTKLLNFIKELESERVRKRKVIKDLEEEWLEIEKEEKEWNQNQI